MAELEDREGSLFATAQDPDGNYVQVIQLSPAERAQMTAPPESGTAGLGVGDAFSGFSVDDLDAAEAFYGGVLGVPVRREEGAMGFLQLDLGERLRNATGKKGDDLYEALVEANANKE